jgi:glycosyltransferase involved in cell wall biosynthesis
MTSICLCMIVKNEVAVIRRCLESVRPVISCWVIVDTGSTDGTQAAIREYLADLPGELHERPWLDFAHNRSEALGLARGKASYTLIIDADDTLDIVPGTTLPALTADCYTIEIIDTATVYRRPQLVRNALPWRYEGVLHEYLTCEGAHSSGHLSEIRIRRNHDGARRKDPQTYRRDAALLEAALRTETSPFLISRYRFYLAQSYRDCGETQMALENYLARAKLEFWTEEIFESLYSAGTLMEKLGRPDTEIIGTYLKAYGYSPGRIESLQALVNYCHRTGKAPLGYLIGKQAVTKPMPAGGLFLKPWVYDYAMLDDFAVAAYWAGEFRDCLDACEKLLASGKLPPQQRERVAKNASLATAKLPPVHAPNTPHVPEDDRGLAINRLLVEATGTTIEGAVVEKAIRFNIFLVSINEHDQIFDGPIRVISSSLNELGYACSVQKNAVQDGAVNIVIGATVYAAKFGTLKYLRGQPHIIYQMEQLRLGDGILNENPEYLGILQAAQFIFEYSPAGMEFLQQAGLGEKAIYLPPSFHNTQAVFVPGDEPDIDVFFYGSHSPRRNKIIDDLRRHGIQAVHAFNVYGEALNQYLRRSKIAINIHVSDGIPTLESFRISFLLANRCFVISETSDHNPYGAGVVYADYESLVAVCLEYLGPKAEQRAMIAEEGYVEYRRSDFVTGLRDALLRVPLEEMLTHRTKTNGSLIMNTSSRIFSDSPAYIPAKLAAYCKLDQAGGLHTGVPYLEFLKLLAAHLNPSSYLEIGTESGISLRQFECDSVCIDPAFQITQNVLLGRKRSFFFQMTSDEFFSQYDARTFFPHGVDVGFLDGLHHFEALLKDFINFERCSHGNSVAILHDCLPTDLVMTSREFQWGGWTGDVWQILPVLKRYRPDLRILLLDCPPTGLVLCCGLDSRSTVLQDRFSEVIDEYSRSVLDEGGLGKLRCMFPLIDTRRLAGSGGGDIGLIIAPTTGHAG